MFDRFFKDRDPKDVMTKLACAILIAVICIITFDALTQDRDSRKQITDENITLEEKLCMMLSDIQGVGETDVMIRCNEEDEVTGIIVTAKGASNPVTRADITDACRALFDIPASNIVVFEKNDGGD